MKTETDKTKVFSPLFYGFHLKNFFLLLVVLLIFYSSLRGLFYFYNRSIFLGSDKEEIFKSFLLGSRFDLVAVVLTNFPVFIYLMLPIRWQHFNPLKKGIHFFFIAINFVFVCINLVDIELYSLTGKRITKEIFKLVVDIRGQAVQLISHYWYFSFFALLLIFLFYYFFSLLLASSSTSTRETRWTRWLYGGEVLLLTILIVFFARGGWQLKPLRSANAFIFSRNELGVLALNSTFTFLRSQGNSLSLPNFVVTSEDKEKYLPSNVSWAHAPTHENLIFIILESFSLEFVGAGNGGKGYTPFLDELIHDGLFFSNGFANGRRSIESLPSLFSGVPSLLPDPFISSDQAGNEVGGLGEELVKSGYQTAFFHGAQNGTMNFDSFTRRTGFSRYFGLNEYPNQGDSDGNWGIFDEPYLQYVVREIGKMRSPFATVIFTLSSHQPFRVPEIYQNVFPSGTLEIHQSIGYTDFALKKFFESAKKEDWFKKTLFVLTADHTTKSDQPGYRDLLGRYRVPILFYRPSEGRSFPPTDTSQVSQHVDIPLSIMHLLGVKPKKWTLMGRSLFSSSKGSAINRMENGYWYLDQRGLVTWQETKGNQYFRIVHGQMAPADDSFSIIDRNDLEKIIKTQLQYFFSSMKNNQLLRNISP